MWGIRKPGNSDKFELRNFLSKQNNENMYMINFSHSRFREGEGEGEGERE